MAETKTDTKTDIKATAANDPAVSLTPEEQAKAAAAAAEAAEAAEKAERSKGLEKGKTYAFVGVFGAIVHPYQDATMMDTDTPRKLVYDTWLKAQVEAGKVKVFE